jgi:hypothetical protein
VSLRMILFATALFGLAACSGSSSYNSLDASSAEAISEEYERQMQVTAEQQARSAAQLKLADEHLARNAALLEAAEAQQQRMEALISRWEEQAIRYDAILSRWEEQAAPRR